MKNSRLPDPLKRIGASIAVLGLFVAVPASQAQDPKAPSPIDNQNKVQINDEPKIKIKDGEGNTVKIKGQAALEMLKPEVTKTWIQGYTVPQEYQSHFTEVPRPEADNIVVRYYGGRAYYVNATDWTIVRAVELDPSVEVTTETSTFVEGYVIPDRYRTRFVEVPNPDAGMSVRYYGNTAYYMDDQYRIVRTVPLSAH